MSQAAARSGRFSGKFAAVGQFAAEPEKPQFDQVKAFRLVKDAHSLLNSFYPAGAIQWLQDNRPDVIKATREAGDEVDKAVLAADQEAFVAALERYTRVHQKAFKVYEGRPPVIEVQAELTM